MKEFQLGPRLWLPTELAARTQAILAQKGAGKTYAAMKETEKLLDSKAQVVCLDPTGVWWGLRSSADGQEEGYSIIVMGGDNADVPLEPTAGEVIADFVQDSGRSVILDMSHFESNAAQDRFVTAFALRLYRIKATKEKRNTIHLMLDEADSFAPQKPLKSQMTMLGAWEAIVRRGRSRGLGLTMISQRPAVLNKNVLTQVDLLVCLRIVGKQDFDAMKEWTSMYATPEQKTEFLESLPQLENGEAWFWSPGWLRIFKRSKIDSKWTFDSSRTPAPGESAHVPKKTAKVDLGKLSAAITATVEKAKANDPRELRRRIAELEESASKNEPIEVEVQAISAAQFESLEEFENCLIAHSKALSDHQEQNAALLAQFDKTGRELITSLQSGLNRVSESGSHPLKRGGITWSCHYCGAIEDQKHTASCPRSKKPTKIRTFSSEQPSKKVRAPIKMVTLHELDGDFAHDLITHRDLSSAEQRILNAVAWWKPVNRMPTRHQAAFVAGYTVNGHFNNMVGKLKSMGLLEYPAGGGVSLTADGEAHAMAANERVTRASLIEKVSAVLKTNALRKVFRGVVDHGPCTREFLASKTGYTVNGHFNNMVGSLKGLGVIEYPDRGGVCLAPMFDL